MNVIITGPKGKMGKLITKVAAQREDMCVVSGVGPIGRDYIGKDIGTVAQIGFELNATVVHDLESVIQQCDVIIDYSTVKFSIEVMEAAIKHKKAVVCGTTGFSDVQFKRMEKISEEIPFLYAANTSRLVNLMYKLLEITAIVIGEAADVEIIEMHDRYKKDAPSGTSKEMGRIVAEAFERNLEEIAVYGRQGHGERIPDSIGYHSIRSGDISSSHKVMFGLLGERLEITHHSYNWECFAQGACEAAAFLLNKPAGFYTVSDVLKI